MEERPVRRKIKRRVEPGPSDVCDFLSTGSTLLDLAISGLVDPAGRGGVPAGRFTEFFGPESSGKSYISGELCGSAQAYGWDQHMIDVERSFEFERSGIFGLDTELDSFHYYPNEDIPNIGSVEDLLGIYEISKESRKVKKGLINRIAESLDGIKPALSVVDSIAVLTTSLESAGKDKRGQSRAKAFSQGFRQSVDLIARKKLAVVFDNQVRDKIGSMFGPSTDSPGGWGVKHYTSVRVRFGYPSMVYEPETEDKKIKEVNGVRIRAEVVKNKIDIPYRSCKFTLIFKYGIDDLNDCALWLKSNTESLSTKQAIYQLPERKGIKGIDNFVKYVEDNDLEKMLIDLTRSEWIRMNTNKELRKPRVRV